jgi:hypothetical protein
MSQLNVDKIVSLAGGGGTAEFQLEASGNFNFDSGTLYVDSTNNRIGVNQASPTVTLHLTGTDGIILPKGTTAERPGAPVEGLFRYNTEDRTFEGYAYDETEGVAQWGPIAGAGGGTPDQSTDRYDANYSVGAILRSNGTEAFWSFDGENDTGWATARIWTHGYVGGGYRNSSPWSNINRTVHSTDTTTNLGDKLDRSGAYMSGSWSDIKHWFHSMENTYRGSSNYTSGFNMATESGIAHLSQWDMTVSRASMGSMQDHVFAGGNSFITGGGQGRTDVFNLKTETMRTSGFPNDYPDGGDDPTIGGHGRLKGWHKRAGTRKGLEWKTESWISWEHGPGGDGWKKCLPSMLGHLYCGTGNNAQNGNAKIDDVTGVNVRSIDFGPMGEENFQMGMRKGYCLGNYNGSQNNQTFKVNYINDGATYLGATTEPKGHDGMSSAHCASASAVTSAAASYDYGTNIPNF